MLSASKRDLLQTLIVSEMDVAKAQTAVENSRRDYDRKCRDLAEAEQDLREAGAAVEREFGIRV